MGHEPWEAETERIWFATWPLKVLPRRIRYETFYDVASLLRNDCLIEHRERYAVRERPS